MNGPNVNNSAEHSMRLKYIFTKQRGETVEQVTVHIFFVAVQEWGINAFSELHDTSIRVEDIAVVYRGTNITPVVMLCDQMAVCISDACQAHAEAELASPYREALSEIRDALYARQGFAPMELSKPITVPSVMEGMGTEIQALQVLGASLQVRTAGGDWWTLTEGDQAEIKAIQSQMPALFGKKEGKRNG